MTPFTSISFTADADIAAEAIRQSSIDAIAGFMIVLPSHARACAQDPRFAPAKKTSRAIE
jgi:hypothetical protein